MKKINIFLCSNDKYMPGAHTLIISLLSNSPNCFFNIFFLFTGKKREMIDLFNDYFEQYNIKIFWLKLKNSLDLSNFKIHAHLTVETYYRLLIAEYVPDNIKKIIYIDSDMVVLKDISLLWKEKFSKNIIFAVRAQWGDTIGKIISNHKEIGLDPNAIYFNAGLLLINLEKWRNENFSKKLIDYAENNQDYIEHEDQDILNVIFYKKWLEVNPLWNYCVILPKNKNEEKWKPYIKFPPNIIHYLGKKKPWLKNLRYATRKHKNSRFFFDYFDSDFWKSNNHYIKPPDFDDDSKNRLLSFNKIFNQIKRFLGVIKHRIK